MRLTEEQGVELVVATLATYSYSLEKAWALRDSLRSAGLCDPAAVAGQDVAGLGNALKEAGYDRGGITYIIAPRLISLMNAIRSGALDPLAGFLEKNDEDGFCSALGAIKGFGPKSARIAWELMASTATRGAAG